MNNPYSPPLAGADAPEPRQKLKLGFWLVSVSLGLAWWLALLVPEASRQLLLAGDLSGGLEDARYGMSPLAVVWGLVRVVGIVTGACALYRQVARSRPKLRWPCAALCVWLGSGLFALSIGVSRADDVPFLLFFAPVFFITLAWFIVLPMLVVSVLALSRTR
jgi:hypothetical protein